MITLDTNIYISALEYGGTPLRLLRAAIDGDVEVAISQPIIDEVLRVLREKFGRSQDRLSQVESFIRSFTILVTATETLNVIREDPDDDRILECAIASRSEAIVSGDRHLLGLGEYSGVRMVKAADFLRAREPR